MDRKILYNLTELGMDDVPHWDILGFYRKKDRSVWVEFLYEGKKRRKKCYNIGKLYHEPELLDRYGVVLSFSQKRAFGAFPGTVDGATMFPVTPTPFYETDVPVPGILDCSD